MKILGKKSLQASYSVCFSITSLLRRLLERHCSEGNLV
jgi:hypothetical protein